jgi:diaminopimelate epimerase
MEMPFIKMHGAGNDFVIVDFRARTDSAHGALSAADLRAIGDRHRGVGFDQLIAIEAPNGAASDMSDDVGADIRLRFWNPDGGEAGACGNGTRCAAALVMGETGASTLAIQTLNGRLGAVRDADIGAFGKQRIVLQDRP